MHPYLDSAGPVAIAHRGGAGEAPENTLPAFERAVARGYRYLETDVHVTRDGVLVAFHDARLDRTTDRSGAIAELTAAEVRAADAGHTFTADGGRTHPFRGRGVHVLRLDEVLEAFPGARVNIDPKAAATVAPLAALIERFGAWDRVGIGAFSDDRIAEIRRLSGGRACTSMGPRALLLAAASAAAFGRMRRYGADCLQVPRRLGRVPLVTPRFVRAAHRAGLAVQVWTINDAPAMHELLDLGVDGLMTDELATLRDVFAERGLPG